MGLWIAIRGGCKWMHHIGYKTIMTLVDYMRGPKMFLQNMILRKL
jgi:hypothetical protein